MLDLVITREQSNLLSGSPIVFISGVSDAKSMLHYNVRKSLFDPIRPGTRVYYVGRRGCAGGVKE